jgi:general secretion pathway protein G
MFRRLVKKTARRSQRGMTLLEIMIVLAILALVMGLVIGPRVMRLFFKSKNDIAHIAVSKYVNETYGDWAMNHTGKQCPESISELAETPKDAQDPWGNPYKLICGTNLPPGAKHIAVYSMGEDGKDNTCDDIQSWDEKHGDDCSK